MFQNKPGALVSFQWQRQKYDRFEKKLYCLPATKSLSINLVFHFSVENVEILLYPGKTKLTCTPNLGRGAKFVSFFLTRFSR